MEKKSKWQKFKDSISWFFKEVMNIYSNKDSFFSKKRIESGIAFIIAEWGMIYYFMTKIDTIGTVELFTWASIQFFVAGYMINQIQKEKTDGSDNSNTPDPNV